MVIKAMNTGGGKTKNRMTFEELSDEFDTTEIWDNNRRDGDGNRLPPERLL